MRIYEHGFDYINLEARGTQRQKTVDIFFSGGTNINCRVDISDYIRGIPLSILVIRFHTLYDLIQDRFMQFSYLNSEIHDFRK